MYTTHFGLREKPFNVTPDPRFFYANPVYREAYASLLTGVQERKGFVVMTGEVGTGKTTLLRRLMKNLEATVRFAYLYNTTLSFEELLAYTCDELGIVVAGDGRLQRIQALNAFLIEQLRRGGTGVLLIDEAQNLEPDVLESLRLLSNLETSTEKLLQIVLVGQPELEAKLAQPGLRQLRQRVSVQCRLDRLKDREVEDYIRLRLETAGARRTDLFEGRAVERIALYSTGIPRLINIICDNALVVAYATSSKRVGADTVDEVATDLGLVPAPESAAPPPAARIEVAAAPAPRAEPRTTADVLRRRSIRKPPRVGWRVPARVKALVALIAVGGAIVLAAPHLTGHLSAMGAAIREGWARAMLLRPWGSPQSAERISSPAPTGATAPAGRDEPAAATASTVPAPAATVPVPAAPVATVPAPASPVPAPAASVPAPPADIAPPAGGLSLPPRPVEAPRTSAERAASASASARPLVIPRGATVADIALKAYGSYNLLAIDLIKELNPHIHNLNWIRAGEALQLPSLDAGTLIRQQADGSYNLIVGSFLSSQAGERIRDRVRRAGYRATLTTRRLTDNLEVHRVELTGLPTREVAQQAWNTARANCWLQIADTPCERTTHG